MMLVYLVPWDTVAFPAESQERFDALMRDRRSGS